MSAAIRRQDGCANSTRHTWLIPHLSVDGAVEREVRVRATALDLGPRAHPGKADVLNRPSNALGWLIRQRSDGNLGGVAGGCRHRLYSGVDKGKLFRETHCGTLSRST